MPKASSSLSSLPIVSNVPEYLRKRRQWIVWQHEVDTTTQKHLKYPLHTGSIRAFIDAHESGRARMSQPYRGSANKQDNLVSFTDALALATYLHDTSTMQAGIAYALIDDDSVVAFDFDRVVKSGVFTDKRVEAVVSDLQTYAEISPSGTGVHAFVAVSKQYKQRLKASIKSWCSFKAGMHEKEDGAQHTVFVGAGFVTVTGNALTTHCVPFNAKADEYVERWFALRFPGQSQSQAAIQRRVQAAPRTQTVDIDDGGVAQQVADALSHIDADCDRDRWIRVGMILHAITGGDERGLKAWDNWSMNAPHRYPKAREQSTRKLYASFVSGMEKGVSLGTLLHMAKEYADPDSRDAVRFARERLQRTIHVAQESLATLAAARGVTTLPTARSAEGLDIVSMTKLPNEATRWLWTHTVPFGHLVLVSGGVSSGKSTLLLKLAADVSKARPLPYDNARKAYLVRLANEFGADNPLAKPYKASGVVYYLTSEMHWTQTAVPTLRRCGAVEKNVYFMRRTVVKDKKGIEKTRPFDLVTDLDRLIKHIVTSKAIPDMIILDPITSFMGTQVDRNAESDVRSILEMMADFCAAIGTAFIGVLHQNKSLDHSGIGKLLGSIAFGAVARVVLFVWPCDAPDGAASNGVRDEWETGSKHFGVTVEKSNIGPNDTAHIFRAAAGSRIGMEVQYVEDKPVRDFLRDMHKKKDADKAPKRDQVVTFVTTQCLTRDFETKQAAQEFVAQNVACSVTYAQQILADAFVWAQKETGEWKLSMRELH